jgi:hypothetical protein
MLEKTRSNVPAAPGRLIQLPGPSGSKIALSQVGPRRSVPLYRLLDAVPRGRATLHFSWTDKPANGSSSYISPWLAPLESGSLVLGGVLVPQE